MIETTEENENGGYRWRFPAITVTVCLLALTWLYQATLWSMVSVWRDSETYAHCSLIFPISAYLIWRRRSRLADLYPRPDWRPLIGILIIGIPWTVANLVDIQVGQQFILMVQIVLTVWAVMGLRVVREIAFPLAFLFFSIPFGEFLVPSLTQYTADFTVNMIQWTGIPIYRDGNTFSLPTGDWSVVEACSGIRYLIASVTLGFLYAYLTYKSLWRRIAFIVLSFIFPIIANGLRAFMIVMTGHFSGMKLAVGIDHLIYGWVFFGIVMLVLFWIGSFWCDREFGDSNHTMPAGEIARPANDRLFVFVGGLAFVSAAIWPLLSAYIAAERPVIHGSVNLEKASPRGGWRLLTKSQNSWWPEYIGASQEVSAAYSSTNGQHVEIFLIYYRNQKQGHELISTENVMIRNQKKVWQVLDTEKIKIAIGDRSIEVNQSRLDSERKKLLVWEWFWVGGVWTSNQIIAKLLEAKAKLLRQNTDSAAVIVCSEYQESVSIASSVLQGFVDTMMPSIESSLRSAASP